MGDEIGKQELLAMIEVQARTAQQMERIANALHEITEEQKVITRQLSNMSIIADSFRIIIEDQKLLIRQLTEGISEKIVSSVITHYNSSQLKLETMATDILQLKILITSISLISILSIIILKLVFHTSI
jgi:hypothetical protein